MKTPSTLASGQAYNTNREKAKGIFVCDMGELFGDWIPESWQKQIFERIETLSQHRFYLLTKQPRTLPKWSPFPENCYVGVSATDRSMLYAARDFLLGVKATVKFLSLEPLLEKPDRWALANVIPLADWVIIGAVTGVKKDLIDLNKKHPKLALMPYGNKWTLQPSVEQVEEIVRACDKAAVPVFLKNNLMPLFCGGSHVAHGLFGSYEYVVGRKRGKEMEWKLRQEVPG